jgi:hypothetical protein
VNASPGSAARPALRFYLGTGAPHWLGLPEFADVPLCVSRVRLEGRRRMPRGVGRWLLDSGAFTELQRFGRWTVSVEEYVDCVRRIIDGVGVMPDAVAPTDFMCEPDVILGRRDVPVGSSRWYHGTRELRGLSDGDPETDLDRAVYIHQQRTVLSFVRLLELAPDLPWMPVLQGWSPESYGRCRDWYRLLGVDLAAFPMVGVGSVCRRQATAEIAQIAAPFAEENLPLHGFGLKKAGLVRYSALFASADSQAWSMNAMHKPRLRECTHPALSCQNCPTYALRWREELLERIACGSR